MDDGIAQRERLRRRVDPVEGKRGVENHECDFICVAFKCRVEFSVEVCSRQAYIRDREPGEGWAEVTELGILHIDGLAQRGCVE